MFQRAFFLIKKLFMNSLKRQAAHSTFPAVVIRFTIIVKMLHYVLPDVSIWLSAFLNSFKCTSRDGLLAEFGNPFIGISGAERFYFLPICAGILQLVVLLITNRTVVICLNIVGVKLDAGR